MMTVDLSTVVPNLDFENYSSLPSGYSQMYLADDWAQLTAATTDYMHADGFLGVTGDTGVAPVPTNGSGGFIGGHQISSPSDWREYAVNVLAAPLESGEEYQLNLFAGTTASGSPYGGAFEGELVVYGLLDASLVSSYSGEVSPIEDFASGNVVELLSIPIDQAASTWTSFLGQRFVPSDDIEALVFGSRSDNPNGYLLIDADGTPPQVTNITLSHEGSATTHAPYEFDDVVGNGEQLRTVPVGSVDRVYVQFTESVTLADTDLELIALSRVLNEPTPTLIQSPTSGNDYTAVWELSSPLLASQYLLRLSDSIVGTNDGLALDGEWTNPAAVTTINATSTFPSGNNISGGDFEFVFTILPGDANRTNTVDVGDLGIISTYYSGSISGRTWAQGDFNGDGFTNVGDLGLFSTFNGTNWSVLAILGDYDNDYEVDNADLTIFQGYYSTSNAQADLNKDSSVNLSDLVAFTELHSFGIDLDVVA